MKYLLITLLAVPFLSNISFFDRSPSASLFPMLKVYDDTNLSTEVSLVSDGVDNFNLEYDSYKKCFFSCELPDFVNPFKIVTDRYNSSYYSSDLFNSNVCTEQTCLSFHIKLDHNNQIAFDFVVENNEHYIYTSYDCCINVETNIGDFLIKLNIKESQTSFFSFEKNDIGTGSSRIVNTFFVPKDEIIDGNNLTISLYNPYTLNQQAESDALTIKEGDTAFLFNATYNIDGFLKFEIVTTAFANNEKISSHAVSDIISKYFTYEASKNNGYLMWPSVVKTWIKNDDVYFLDLSLESIVIYDFHNVEDYKTGQNKTFKTTLKNKCDKMQTLYDIYERQNKSESKLTTIFFYCVLAISLSALIILLLLVVYRRLSRKKSN